MGDLADIAIIGGGAAGLTAAIFAARRGKRVVILDGAKTLGAKILVSGGGRCNVTHHVVTPEDFNGKRTVVRNILAAFPAKAAVEWFASMGVELKREDTGKLFPVADSARAVFKCPLKTLRCVGGGHSLWMQSNGDHQAHRTSSLFYNCTSRWRATSRSSGDVHWREITTAERKRRVRMGDCKTLGHSVTPTYAALAPLVLDQRMFHASVAGIALEVELKTFAQGRIIDRRQGSLLWTHFGISGPVVMDASRHWIIAQQSGLMTKMECNFLAADDHQTVEKWLVQQTTQRPKAALATVFAARLPERIAKAILAHADVDLDLVAGQLSREMRGKLVRSLTALPLPVLDHRGWNYAEVTAGGVPLNEINFQTMESRKTPGLFLAGEVLDCDGRIGGFNFQWAWATGQIAGSVLSKV